MEIFSKSMLISFIITLSNAYPELDIPEKLEEYQNAFNESVRKNQDIKLSFMEKTNEK